MRALDRPPPLPVEIAPMRRRHLRDVLAIERAVYPRAWSASLFASEIAQKATRTYIVSLWRRKVVGYGGLMCHFDEGHVTTVAVAPEYQNRRVGSRLLFELVSEARRRDVRTCALEVRVANWPAQRLYARFGFRPVGLRRNYYAETGEDALVMWVDDLQSEVTGRRLARIAATLGRPRG